MGKTYKLGILDDELIILKGLCNYYPWKELGFEVNIASTDSLRLLEELHQGIKIDALLCDISMPDMDGIELVDILSKEFPDILIVFLSGYSSFDYAKKAVQYGVIDYLLKPVKYDELIQTFRKVHKELMKKEDSKENYSDSFHENLINKMHILCQKNIRNVSRKMISNELQMSEGYLSVIHKKVTGKSLNEYLVELRMETARKYLIDSDMKIYEIAETIGYTNPKNFSRAFTSFFGKSPSAIRNPNDRE